MIGSRLEALYEKMCKQGRINSKKEFCNVLGIDYGSLAKYITDKVNFSIGDKNYKNFANENINIQWLLTGEGEMFFTAATDTPAVQQTKIPLLSQKVSCGPGQEWNSEQNIEEYIDVTELAPKLNKKNIYAFRASGTSMLGAGIKDGDIVLFSASPDQDLVDGIYVFSLDGDAYCKRLEFDPIASRIKIYSVRVSDLEKAELLATLNSTDPGYAERFCLFGRVYGWIHPER